MKRILFASAVAIVLSIVVFSPATADKNVDKVEVTPLAEKVPAQSEMKINDGALEGHIKPNDVLKKAIKAAKADDLATLKGCFGPDVRDQLDEDSWDEKDGENKLTNAAAMARILKTYPDEGGKEIKQGTKGDYAIIAIANGEARYIVDVQRTKKWDEKTEKNWFLTSYQARNYRVDYNAPALKEVRDIIEKGDIAKLKEKINSWMTGGVLDLITGVDEGVDGYALLLKRFKQITDNGSDKSTESTAKPILLKNRGGTSIAYWFHSDTADTFLVLDFNEQIEDWQTKKKYTEVTFNTTQMSEGVKDPAQFFKNWVGDW